MSTFENNYPAWLSPGAPVVFHLNGGDVVLHMNGKSRRFIGEDAAIAMRENEALRREAIRAESADD